VALVDRSLPPYKKPQRITRSVWREPSPSPFTWAVLITGTDITIAPAMFGIPDLSDDVELGKELIEVEGVPVEFVINIPRLPEP
jgi:hypothetical protein